jgi:large subunit ribosomal protein L29
MLKLKDLRGEDSPELTTMLQDLRKEAFELTFRSSAENVSNPSRQRQIRRTVARIMTILREREIATAKAATTNTQNA